MSVGGRFSAKERAWLGFEVVHAVPGMLRELLSLFLVPSVRAKKRGFRK